MGSGPHQYSSVKIHLTLASQIRKIRCLVVSLFFAVAIAIAFAVLYIIKRSEIVQVKDHCSDASCVKVAAGNFLYSKFEIYALITDF